MTSETESPVKRGDGPSTILVGIDGTDTSLHAGAYAAGLARRQGAALVVVFVESAPALSALAGQAYGAIQEDLTEIARELKAQLDEAIERFGVRAEFLALAGDPFTELSRIADERRVDAVIVGASEQAGHRIVGSLGVRLVRAGRWPVTVVP